MGSEGAEEDIAEGTPGAAVEGYEKVSLDTFREGKKRGGGSGRTVGGCEGKRRERIADFGSSGGRVAFFES